MAFFQAITIIGLPLAYANVKMIGMTVAPFGRQIVRTNELQHVPPGAIVLIADQHQVSGGESQP
jgi:uncharacterized membrane protein YccF (DUF307 family)